MSTPALVGMILLNAWAAYGFWRAGNYGMVVTFSAYAVAIGGFLMESRS